MNHGANPNGRMRARRRDPFRRAVGAPRVVSSPAPCPRGECEHTEMGHEGSADSPDTMRCAVAGCTCGKA